MLGCTDGRAGRILRGMLNAEEFAETIPFTETRGYVQAVYRNAEIYRALYGGAGSAIAGLGGTRP